LEFLANSLIKEVWVFPLRYRYIIVSFTRRIKRESTGKFSWTMKMMKIKRRKITNLLTKTIKKMTTNLKFNLNFQNLFKVLLTSYLIWIWWNSKWCKSVTMSTRCHWENFQKITSKKGMEYCNN
jgi:hypothetical protein